MKTRSFVLFAGTLLFSGTVASADLPMTFEELDTDGNGYISHSEAGASKDLTENWQTIDKNADNQLDIKEFSTFVAEGRLTPPEESEEPGLGAAPF